MRRYPVVPVVLVALSGLMTGAAPLVVYDDELRNGFDVWPWAVLELHATDYVHGGTYALWIEPDSWDAAYLHRDATIDGALYEALDFWIHGGGVGGQDLDVVFLLNGTERARLNLAAYLPGGTIPASTWVSVHIPFDPIGLGAGQWNELWIQDASGTDQARVFLDDISVAERPPPPPVPVSVTVAPDGSRRPIDPRIYGVNGGETNAQRYPLYRWGGNATTRYNWQNDVSNRAMDWFYLNIAYANDPGQLPHGSEADKFIDNARLGGSEAIVTVPLIGWTPKDRTRSAGFSEATYGTQTNDECREVGGNPPPTWCNPDAGNGWWAPNVPVTGNLATDTSVAIGPPFVTSWMAHVASRVGTASQGGVRLWALDNETMLWSDTHRDVHPTELGSLDLWQRTQAMAAAMKAQDPAALLMGPVTWGWCDLFWTDLDNCGNNGGPDYTAYGPFLSWYLDKICQYQSQYGVRPVDVIDVHYYPQGTGVALSDDESASTSALRLRSVKDLYDPTYTAESWIGTPVYLIPRLKALIAARCPGLQLAITEYNWGNDTGLSSALAQVEVLGIFGREGVDMATRWEAPAPGTRVEDAFQMFLDYDGAGSKALGDSVAAASGSVNDVGAYAIRSPSNRLHVYLVNKSTVARTVNVSVAGTLSGNVALYGFDGAGGLGSRGTVVPAGQTFVVAMPARAAWLAVVQLDCPPLAAVAGLSVGKLAPAQLRLTWANVSGATDYVVFEDASPSGTFGTQTGVAASGTTGLTVAMPAGNRYYRVRARNGCGLGL